MTTHTVKSWPEYFDPICHGIKNFDLRKDDRPYEVGDEIVFEEFRPFVGEYTGATAHRRVIYILRNFEGLLPGFCILGLTREIG